MKKVRDKWLSSFSIAKNLEMKHFIQSEWKIMKSYVLCVNQIHQITGLDNTLGFENLIEPTSWSHDHLLLLNSLKSMKLHQYY